MSNSLRGFARFAHFNPQPKAVLAFLAGLTLVLLFTAGRLYTTKWPIHPVFFLIWNAWPAPHMTASFLLAWLVKVTVMKYGGASVYRALRPIAFGLIGGELIFGILNILFGAIYYFTTKQYPPSYGVMLQ